MEECKKQDRLDLMFDIEKYLNKADTEGWLTILRYFELENRADLAKKPPSLPRSVLDQAAMEVEVELANREKGRCDQQMKVRRPVG